MNSRSPNGSWSFSLVGHWAEPQRGQWVLRAMVGCQLFIVSSAKGIYWFQINFYRMQLSQHEMLHCHSSVTDNPLQNPIGETAATTWTPAFKITLGEVSWPWTEAGGAQRAFPSLGGGTALQAEWQCRCTFCSSPEQSWGKAEPGSGVVLCSPQQLLHEGGECVLAAPQTCSLQKVLSERKKNKTEEAKMNNFIIIWCAEILAEISSKIHIVYSSWWVSQVLKLCSRLKC